MQFIPKSVLSKLYNRTSLRNDDGGVRFSIKNRLSPAKLGGISQISINSVAIPAEGITVSVESGEPMPLADVNSAAPTDFPLGTLVNFFLDIDPLLLCLRNDGFDICLTDTLLSLACRL